MRQNDAIKTNANKKKDDLFSFLIKLDEPKQDIEFTFKIENYEQESGRSGGGHAGG
jgi:patatin-like phospholipase/acyl hydrolase